MFHYTVVLVERRGDGGIADLRRKEAGKEERSGRRVGGHRSRPFSNGKGDWVELKARVMVSGWKG